MRCARTFRLARTHPAHARLSGSETLSRSRSLAGYTIDTHESEFSEATGVGLELLLPSEQHTRRDPIATRHLGKAGTRLPRLLNDAAFVRLAEAPPMAIARRRNDERRPRRAVSHMTNAMTKGMTKPVTKPAASVEQPARRRLRLSFELRPPIAKRLQRKPVSFTILSLIQIALTPRLVMRA